MPYVIDSHFNNAGQEPTPEPQRLPDPLARGPVVSNPSDGSLVRQLLTCAFAVPAYEVFPDRQSVLFGETETVYLDLTQRQLISENCGRLDTRLWLVPQSMPAPTVVAMPRHGAFERQLTRSGLRAI